jgi:hypothetical protein
VPSFVAVRVVKPGVCEKKPRFLEEAEHVPLEVAEVAAELQRVAAAEPREVLAELEDLVVVLAGRAEQRVAERLESLHGPAREPKGLGAAEPDSRDAELGDEVGAVRLLAEALQLHPLVADAQLAHEGGAERVDRCDAQVLDGVVVVGAEARQVLRCEAVLLAVAVAREHR